MDPAICTIVLGAVVAGFVQGLSGFAFAMVAMSFWAWTVEPQLAAVLSVFGGLTGQIVAALTVRRGFDLKYLAPFLIGGLAGIPIGIAVLPLLDVHVFKAMIGVMLIIWCPVMLLSRHLRPITFDGRLANGTVGLLGGILGGIGGFAGVFPTLWCTLRQIEKDKQRSIIQNFNLTMLGCTMTAYIANGTVTRAMLPIFAIVAPAILVPVLIGTRLYIGISEITFRRIILTLLTASGLALLASSVPALIGRF